MARSRNIKPSIMDNEELAELEPITRLLFIYLWMLADREGRLEDRPKRIAAQALAYDRTADVGAMLDRLQALGFITRYTANGIACIQITGFSKHQTPHGTEKDSALPDVNGATTIHVRGKNGYATGEVQVVNSALTVKKQSVNTLNPDSGFLIPDSLIPDSLGESAPAKRTPPTKLVIAKPDDVSEQTWADWLQLRKSKKAPVTVTVVDGAKGEADKAGMTLEEFLRVWCRRGSQGLEASWLKENERAPPTETAYQASQRRKVDILTGRNRSTGTVVDCEIAFLENEL